MATGKEFRRGLGLSCVRFQRFFFQELDCVGGVGYNETEYGLVNVIEEPRGDHLLSGFVGLQGRKLDIVKCCYIVMK